MDGILQTVSFLQVGWKDLLEILLVAYLIYRVLLLWTGTRAFQILFGLVLLVAVYAMASLLEFQLISYILQQAFTYGVFALIVVFQPELRSALAQLGRSRLWRIFPRMEEREREVAEEVAKAAERLSRAKIGGIIAIEREVGLNEYAETGTRVDAAVSADLLTTIFTPYSPLHDGAVLIRGHQIVAAGCILPLTQFPISDRSLGTRHRAALGLSEETDALVVVVSEESSQISLARRGVLRRGLTAEQLRARLAAERQAPSADVDEEVSAAGVLGEGETIVTSVRVPEAEATEDGKEPGDEKEQAPQEEEAPAGEGEAAPGEAPEGPEAQRGREGREADRAADRERAEAGAGSPARPERGPPDEG